MSENSKSDDYNVNEPEDNGCALPDWWRVAKEIYEEYDLKPYRPPRFEDDVIKRPIVKELEQRFDVDIRFVCFEARHKDDWSIFIDDEQVTKVGRHRDPKGYTVYEIRSDEFRALVHSAIYRRTVDALR